MSDDVAGTTKLEKQGLSIGQSFAKAAGGNIAAFIHDVKSAIDNVQGYGGLYRMVNGLDSMAHDYLAYGYPFDANREKELAFMSPRAGFLYYLESAVTRERSYYGDIKAERVRQSIVDYAASTLTVYAFDIAGKESGKVTKPLPYEERMESLKWLITDHGHDANKSMFYAVNNDRKMADWMLEKGGADINFISPREYRIPDTAANNLYIQQVEKLMYAEPRKDLKKEHEVRAGGGETQEAAR